MPRSERKGSCGGDFYCDANAVCGVRCAEIDLLEGNTHALRATAHHATDANGLGSGLGGSLVAQLLSAAEYGPGRTTVDTRRPFRVSVFFGEEAGVWAEAEVTLRGASGRSASFAVAKASYPGPRVHTLPHLAAATASPSPPAASHGAEALLAASSKPGGSTEAVGPA